MSSCWRTRISLAPIDSGHYQAVIDADRAVYPTTTRGLTVPTLARWYGRYPDFGMLFSRSDRKDEIVAWCIAVPLKCAAWQRLLRGELLESELDEGTLFDNTVDDELGIHIYHIEKSLSYPSDLPRFGIVALEGLADVLMRLRALRVPVDRPPLHVQGLSGLATSRAGVSLFANLYGCRERDAYICKEHLLRNPASGHQLEVHEAGSVTELRELILERGLEYVVRARMMAVMRSEPSLVWTRIFDWSTFDQISNLIPEENKNKWVRELDEDLVIVHPPGAHVTINCIDPVLGKTDIARGYVNMTDLVRVLGEEGSAPLLQISEEDRNLLTKISLAAFDVSQRTSTFGQDESCDPEREPDLDPEQKRMSAGQPRMYVYQGDWSTLDAPNFSFNLNYNIRVK